MEEQARETCEFSLVIAPQELRSVYKDGLDLLTQLSMVGSSYVQNSTCTQGIRRGSNTGVPRSTPKGKSYKDLANNSGKVRNVIAALKAVPIISKVRMNIGMLVRRAPNSPRVVILPTIRAATDVICSNMMTMWCHNGERTGWTAPREGLRGLSQNVYG